MHFTTLIEFKKASVIWMNLRGLGVYDFGVNRSGACKATTWIHAFCDQKTLYDAWILSSMLISTLLSEMGCLEKQRTPAVVTPFLAHLHFQFAHFNSQIV